MCKAQHTPPEKGSATQETAERPSAPSKRIAERGFLLPAPVSELAPLPSEARSPLPSPVTPCACGECALAVWPALRRAIALGPFADVPTPRQAPAKPCFVSHSTPQTVKKPDKSRPRPFNLR
jgi:hypothetical protein